MKVELLAFQVLFYLGAAKELEVKGLKPPIHISKHAGNHKKAVKMGKWNGRRYR